jgi:hypothetical protein
VFLYTRSKALSIALLYLIQPENSYEPNKISIYGTHVIALPSRGHFLVFIMQRLSIVRDEIIPQVTGLMILMKAIYRTALLRLNYIWFKYVTMLIVFPLRITFIFVHYVSLSNVQSGILITCVGNFEHLLIQVCLFSFHGVE